jgi:hypothetical protein
MPLPDTMMTYAHYLAQISAMKPAYVQLVRYVPLMDVPVEPDVKQIEDSHPDRPYKRGTPHDVLAVYGGIIKPPLSSLEQHREELIRGLAMPKPEFDAKNPSPTRLFVNGGLAPEEAEDLLAKGFIDAAVFGTLWISNPDLQKRIEKGLPINTQPDVKTFYAVPGDDPRVGYTTYPEAEDAKL